MQISFDQITQTIQKKRGRPKKKRNLNYTPTLTVWEPVDGAQEDNIVKLGHDELEALRLKNINGLGIIKAAHQMGISKSLFAKIYKDATKKVTMALIYGRSLHIQVGQGNGLDFVWPIL